MTVADLMRARAGNGDRLSAREASAYEHHDPARLRKLAAWYREFADRAGNPMIWECRLRTAQELDAEADRIEIRLENRAECRSGGAT